MNKEVNLDDKMQSVDSVIGKNSNKPKKRGKFGRLRGDKPSRKSSDSQMSATQSANSLSSNKQVVFRRRIF